MNDKKTLKVCGWADSLLVICMGFFVFHYDGQIPPWPIRILVWTLALTALAFLFTAFCIMAGGGPKD